MVEAAKACSDEAFLLHRPLQILYVSSRADIREKVAAIRLNQTTTALTVLLMTALIIISSLVLAAVIVATGIYVVVHIKRNSQPDLNPQAMELLNQSVNGLNHQVTQLLTESSKSISDRLDNTNTVVGDLRQKLGRLEEASRQMLDVGKDISRLQDILQPPKLRGSMGEFFLHDLLAQILPSHNFEMQYKFKGGETVDAVIKLNQGLVPVDAKFPLDNFRRIIESGSDEDKKSARKAFLRDVKIHVDAISSKYIRMDEDTLDFALMYIPAENVYYETIIKDDESATDPALFSYAITKRVIPVSPNTFYAYLQTIFLGLRGMRVEEKSREILENIARVQKEFEKFSEAFRLVGQHLDNSSKKYMEAQKRFGALGSKIEQVDGLAKGLEATDSPKAVDE
jgi:DNA recombination protein RmuC